MRFSPNTWWAIPVMLALFLASAGWTTAAEFVLLDRTLGADAAAPSRYQELTYSTAQWYGSTFWTGPNWTRVGKNWHHPGENTPSVRCFQTPRSGRVTISGRVFKLHASGDGIRALILHNDREVWRTEIEGTDDKGVEPDLSLDVRQGDALRFVVHKRVEIFCDTTGWDPVITYADGKSHHASDAFEDHKQGSGGWRYEMDAYKSRERGVPTVRALSDDLALVEFHVTAHEPLALTNRDCLPAFVVSNGADDRGIAIAAALKQPWKFDATCDQAGRVRVTLATTGGENTDPRNKSDIWNVDYDGAWPHGFRALETRLAEDGSLSSLQEQVVQASDDAKPLSLALRVMVQADWKQQDKLDGTTGAYAQAATAHLERARALLHDLHREHGREFLADELDALDRLTSRLETPPEDLAAARGLWIAARRLKRRITLANPLLDFGPLLICKRVPPSWSHLVAQYFGWRQRPGGGLYVLSRPGYSLETRDILEGQLPPGSVLEPRLSYDAQRILFSFVPCTNEVPNPASLPVNESGGEDRYFHLYEVQVDGTQLRQLTDGPYDDMMAEYLPDGGVVFCSTRRKGYSRCFGAEYSYRWHSYTLHRMDAPGGPLRALSFNDVNEWFPAVSNSGHILFARWDYIDRDAVTHQNLWSVRPDGTNPVAVWGNATPKPHCTFQAKPIPQSNKIVFIASAHHSITAGPVCVVDPSVDHNSPAAVTRITPGPFPESESNDIPEYFESPWPLSGNYFLVAYSGERLRFQGEHQSNPNPDNALGIYLIDAAGNRELIYRDPQISSTNPTPLAERPRPPALPSRLPAEPPPTGEMVVTDVYAGLGDIPRGSIKQIRVVQLFPKTTWLANQPRIGFAGEENARAVLGTVPVEEDGSARFLVPACKPVFFQVLDEDGFAYQTMRSLTYAQPGERIACVGCHEHRQTAPVGDVPQALLRSASTIDPGELGGRPFSFVEVVQPVLDAHCVRCHGGEKTEGKIDLSGTPHEGFTKSYWSLCKGPMDWRKFQTDPQTAQAELVPRFAQRNQIQVTPPGGQCGARGSRLMSLIGREGEHYDVKLSRREHQALAAWIDLNAIFYGVYDPQDQARQLRGERVAMPEIQ
jgi:hypothetical protein